MHIRLSAAAIIVCLTDLGLVTKRKSHPLSPEDRAHIIRCNVRLIETDSLGYESAIEEKQVFSSGVQAFQYGKDNIYVGVNEMCEVLEMMGLREDITHVEFNITFQDVDGNVKKIRRAYLSVGDVRY
ncbi:hypothetical protein PspLS_10436 [Pyricularia sp. CBS 133598]|nr:hypothetical protein PspLS_10436 [Pyricularia sp. CBS 133598]